MKKKIEREEFNIEEVQQVEEFVSFKAEEYKGKEIKLQKDEVHKTEEFQIGESDNIINDSQNENKKFNIKDFVSKQSTNSIIKSSITTLGTAGTLIAAAVVGGNMIIDNFPPIFSFNEIGNNLSEKIELLRYHVDYIYDESNNLVPKVFIEFKNDLNENYTLKLSNDDECILNSSKNELILDNLGFDNYELELEIFDEKMILKDTYSFEINTISPLEYEEEILYDHLITYNLDDTYNKYIYPIIEKNDDYEYETFIYVVNNDDEIVNDYQSIYENGLAYIEDISNPELRFRYDTYLIDSNASYLLGRNYSDDINVNNANYQFTINQDMLTIYLNNKLASDLSISINYLDLNINENIIISMSDYSDEFNEIQIPLTHISEQIEVSIEGQLVLYDENYSNNIYPKKGTKFKNVLIKGIINCDITSNLNIIEIEKPYDDYDGNKVVNVLVDGYLKKNETYSINVYDSTMNLLDSVSNVDKVKSISFMNLPEEELSIELVINDSDNNEISSKSKSFTNILKEEYQNIVSSYLYANPSDIQIVYNDDETYNAYIYSKIEHDTEYNIFARVSILDGGEIIQNIDSYNSVAIVENIPLYTNYGLKYTFYLKEDDCIYQVYDSIVPSGVIGDEFDFTTLQTSKYGYMEYDVDNNEYYAVVEGEFLSDCTMNIVIDSTTVIDEIIISQSDLIFDGEKTKILIKELEGYSFEHVDIKIEGRYCEYKSMFLSEIKEIIGPLPTNYGCEVNLEISYYA